ncbi:O-antigen ligase family protein [Rhodococcus sp. BP-241]|uniref:O-antigen ligase family protein n=1 Tax=Rhodococcus sp. BP-241 TaxID=2739441 RepID=UPI001C9A952B|nr:O-antigen ligase family protein [Rhodococcus sp. BP-241]MBY6707822.1 O-antigen ligase family protein [Rhodococcus sp. BP-241]
MTDTVTDAPAAPDTRFRLTIALLLGSAIAVVGVGRPSIGGITPTVVLVVAACGATLWARRRQRVPATVIDVLLVLSLALRAVVELIDTHRAGTAFGTGMIADAVLVLAMVYVVRSVFATGRDLVVLAWGTLIPAAGVSVLALLQVVDTPGVNSALSAVLRGSALADRVERGAQIRATGTIGHWTSLGAYLCVAIAIGCALLIHLHRTGRPTRAVAAVLTVLTAAEFATLTFATVGVAAVVLLSTLVHVRPSRRAVLAAAGVAVLAWIAMSGQIMSRVSQQSRQRPDDESMGYLPETIRYRIRVWDQQTIPAIQENILFGHGSLVYRYIGTDKAPSALVWSSPESQWLRTLIQFGAIAMILEIVAVVVALVLLIELVVRYDMPAFLPVTVMAVLMTVIMTIHSHLYDRAFSMLFWSVAVTAAVAVRTARRRSSAQNDSSPTTRTETA